MSSRPFNQLRNAIKDPGVNVVSVDVFDTLLLRDSTPELARFRMISHLQAEALNRYAALNLSSEDFYLLRREAARTVYTTKTRQRGGREATWREIFELIFTAVGIPIDRTWLELCADVEFSYEKERLTLNSPLCQLLQFARNEGKSVVCLSDMYLSSERIRQLIDTVAGKELGIPVYSSADHGFGKGCGALYERLSEDYSVKFLNILHCGDNWHADFQVPKSLGIRAHYLPRATSWRLVRRARAFWYDRALPAL